jgi:hypothetical protein
LGTVFKVTTNGLLTTLVKFNGTNGWGPRGLTLGSDGNFYGTAGGGIGGSGVIYRLNLFNSPNIGAFPSDQTILAGGNATLTVTAFGVAPFSYQWLFNGTNITDATNSSLTISSLTHTNAGSYQVIVTNAFGSVTSSVATLTVSLPPPVIFSTNSTIGFSNGQFGFSFSGPAGSTVVIEGTTSLGDWLPLQTNVLGNGPVYFSDPASSSLTTRFYRAVLLP